MCAHAHADRYLVAVARRTGHVGGAQRAADRCLLSHLVRLVLAESRVACRGGLLRAVQSRRPAGADTVRRGLDPRWLGHLLASRHRPHPRTVHVDATGVDPIESLVGAAAACLLTSVHSAHGGAARQATPLVAAAGVRDLGELPWRGTPRLRAPRRRPWCSDIAGAADVAAGSARVSRLHAGRDCDAARPLLLVRDPQVTGTYPSLSARRVAAAAFAGPAHPVGTGSLPARSAMGSFAIVTSCVNQALARRRYTPAPSSCSPCRCPRSGTSARS